jgi:hypothetical protein
MTHTSCRNPGWSRWPDSNRRPADYEFDRVSSIAFHLVPSLSATPSSSVAEGFLVTLKFVLSAVNVAVKNSSSAMQHFLSRQRSINSGSGVNCSRVIGSCGSSASGPRIFNAEIVTAMSLDSTGWRIGRGVG